jgi:hypothetical protein
MSNGQERRKYKRYEKLPIGEPIVARVKIRSDETQEVESNDWDLVNLLNISAGGTFFYYTKYLGIGTLLYLKIDVFKSTPTITCVGKIVRSDKLQSTSVFCIATEFTEREEKELINKTLLKVF